MIDCQRCLVQALAEPSGNLSHHVGCATVQEADEGHWWLLRPRSEWPGNGRAAEERDKFSPPHSTPSNDDGTVYQMISQTLPGNCCAAMGARQRSRLGVNFRWAP
jgi:hypothetical protein